MASVTPQLLDCVGLLCPVPIHLLARRLTALPTGAQVEVRCDDPTITDDLPSWSRATGHAIVAHRIDGDCHCYVVEKR